MANRGSSGYSVPLVVSALAAGGALIVTSLGTRTSMVHSAPAPAAEAGQSRHPLKSGTLLRLTGLAPEVCAAAGLSVDQTAGLVARSVQHLAQNAVPLQESLESEARLKRVVAQLESATSRGESNADQLAGQRQALADASNQKAEAIAGLLRASLGDLDAGLTRNLSMIREQHGLGIPIAYLLERRTEADAIAIRDALADQKIARDKGEELSEATSRFLADHPPSQSAVTNLQNLAAYREVWARALDAR